MIIYFKCTAGFVFIARQCGVIVDFREIFPSENPSQLFVKLLQRGDEEQANIQYMGYNQAYEFNPFFKNLAT